ncbi:hypothetical protein [Aliidiomarina sp. B3213]|nr:hypothetical protein [Aliidiomarina sp. B3213]RTE85491.1 hypothetical protein DQX04_11345 [Aliidiomarina sp. B3213]
MDITDSHDQLLYESAGELALLSPTWTISQNGLPLARVQRKILSFVPTWLVSGELGNFQIKRKVFSVTRCYVVIGGVHDGVTIEGNWSDLEFSINSEEGMIAMATGSAFSLRDKHRIEVVQPANNGELLTVIAMTTLLMDKRSQRFSLSVNSNN